MKPIKQELQDRGLLYQFSDEKIFELLDQGGKNFYCGFDPTADSLHLGNFIGFMVALHIMRRGNIYTALTGGATGMIGDPGGRTSERTFLSAEILENNQKAISNQISNMLEKLSTFTKEKYSYKFVNNKDFYENMGILDFLREVGKFITVNVMINRETVKKRIEDPSQSISYTEFSYQLLQGYDFAKMHKEDDMILQIGGQDQWGNLLTGVELIRKKYDTASYALTWPLITDSTGKKFGKSEGNAMFLDGNKTTPYFIYQYFMNTTDEDISRYMKMLTLIETEEIDKIVENHLKNPENREGQKILAFKVVEIVHGTKKAELCQKISEFMFGENDKVEVLKTLTEEELKVFQNSMGGFDYAGENFFEIIVASGLETSNSNARQAVSSGAIHINSKKITDAKYDFSADFINDKFLLLQKGKKNFRIILK
ncbi:tyrosine--tRNA ligase [Candidatus Gracilibacteria bacterium]|nr:MAG: tyrosine--tRNA ligase [Candidatus Gracilibacteria bacterium]